MICSILISHLGRPNLNETIVSSTSFSGKTSSTENSKVRELFSFAPGWAMNNLEKINFKGLATLAYFDVPISEDGTLYRDGNGYSSFKENSPDLVERAHANGTKVVLTLSQMDGETIKQILDSKEAQTEMILGAIAEVKDSGIDGINVDFEHRGDISRSYREKYVNFINKFSKELHQEVPNSQLSVSLSDSLMRYPLYDSHALSQVSDRIFMMADDFAVPEYLNSSMGAPIYGIDQNQYGQKLITIINGFLTKVPADKLVLETAWYGNGNEYPLTDPNSPEGLKKAKAPGVSNTLSAPLPRDVINGILAGVPDDARDAARRNLPAIVQALQDENILDENVLAYAMATIEHETAGTFEPIEEIQGRNSARRLGYEGGTDYFGRGFIQLTHLRNYKTMGKRIGLGDALVNNPALALKRDISAKILAAYFKDNGIATLAAGGYFVDARIPINPDYQGWWIASLAYKYLIGG